MYYKIIINDALAHLTWNCLICFPMLLCILFPHDSKVLVERSKVYR